MIGPNDLLAAMQNGVIAVRDMTTSVVAAVDTINATVSTLFPRGTLTSSAPSVAGATVFTSSQADAFLLVTTSSGAQYKMPLYPL